ncbi:MAG: tol-pal system-associated acyl-CoA thioesterase [Pseudomonadota bacterium]
MMPGDGVFRSEYRVYYEDTDMAGIVYYANYLRFLERARSDLVRFVGIDQQDMRSARDLVFAVKRVEIEYRAPARFGEILTVLTETTSLTPARFEMTQRITVDSRPIVDAVVQVVCMSAAGRPRRIPTDIRDALTKRITNHC